jgi:hypothetical protein
MMKLVRNRKEELKGNTLKQVNPAETSAAKDTSATPKPHKNIHKRSKFSRKFINVMDGTFLTRENFVKNLPFLLYLTLLTIGYIANTYYSEKTIRDTSKTKKEIKELKSEYITIKSALMDSSRLSRVERRVYASGIKQSLEAPEKIFIDDTAKTVTKKSAEL